MRGSVAHGISRARRAQIQRHAQQIRLQGQLAGWSISRIIDAIRNDLPEVRALEAWRLAHGWSRSQVVARITALYEQDGLRAPALNTSMLCRWEHGEAQPGIEYSDVLCRLYHADPGQLGLPDRFVVPRQRRQQAGSASGSPENPQTAHEHCRHALAAVWESVQFAMEVEGPCGGPLSRDQLAQAVRYYDLNYSTFPPDELAPEVHRCRALVRGMLNHDQTSAVRRELRLLGGWFSALLGNLALHRADFAAAAIHLRVAAGLGADVGHNRLIGWALGAQSMLARYRSRYPESLALARRAVQHADNSLRRAQLISWAELPALAHLGRSREARSAALAAQRAMDAADHSRHGRFGFDIPELELHLAEAELVLGNARAAEAHAQGALAHATARRPAWIAATLTLALSEVQGGLTGQAAERGLHVLDSIEPSALRETSRQRLARLDQHVTGLGQAGGAVNAFHERVLLLPSRPAHTRSLDGSGDDPAL